MSIDTVYVSRIVPILPSFGGLDGLGIEAVVDVPTVLATDEAGHIFVIEAGGRLRRIEPDGKIVFYYVLDFPSFIVPAIAANTSARNK